MATQEQMALRLYDAGGVLGLLDQGADVTAALELAARIRDGREKIGDRVAALDSLPAEKREAESTVIDRAMDRLFGLGDELMQTGYRGCIYGFKKPKHVCLFCTCWERYDEVRPRCPCAGMTLEE